MRQYDYVPPQPKNDQHGRQRAEKDTGRPMWQTQVFVMDETGGEVITVTGGMADTR